VTDRAAGRDGGREPLAVLLPVAVGLGALVLANRSGPPVGVGLVALVLPALLAALYRPWGGGSLGLGTLLLPTLAAHGELAAAGWLAGIAVLGSELLDRQLWLATGGGGDRRQHPRRVASAAGATAAAIVGSTTWAAVSARLGAPGERLLAASDDGSTGPGFSLLLALAAATLAHVAVAGGLLWATARLARPASARFASGLRPLRPLGLDAAGWVVGAALATVAAAQGWVVGGVLLAGLVGLSLFATRGDLLRAALARRLSQVLEAQEAGERVLTEGAGTGIAALADRIRRETRVAVASQWFELTLLAGPDAPRCWSGRTGTPLAEGPATPPPSPPPLPGVHRRPKWRLFDRQLAGEKAAFARLRLWCDPRQLEPRSEELLDSLLPQLAASLERAVLEHAANTDALTGLASRRVFDERLAATFRVAREEGTTLAVALFDLDHFKAVNDRHGHATGDRALQAAAAALRSQAGGHLAARYGGEELVVLMVGGNGRAGLELAERVRQSVHNLALDADGTSVALTLSAGVAAQPELFARSDGELVQLADAALYEAKRRGRDRCLLCRGRGHYETIDGSAIDAPGTGKASDPSVVRAPQFFA
jgi:diguanylate cyclase (GGDEF)-like protein